MDLDVTIKIQMRGFILLGHKINAGVWQSCIYRHMEKMTQLKILPLVVGVSRSTVDCYHRIKVGPMS